MNKAQVIQHADALLRRGHLPIRDYFVILKDTQDMVSKIGRGWQTSCASATGCHYTGISRVINGRDVRPRILADIRAWVILNEAKEAIA